VTSAKDLKDIDVVFFSAFDHNEGKDAHGLFQMFKFFRNKLEIKSIFLNTNNSKFTNNIDVFNISKSGGNLKLSHQISPSFIDDNNAGTWRSFFKNNIDLFYKMASDSVIKELPKHKFLVITDVNDIDLNILEKVANHFESKILIISAVNNTWTGLCSYPKEYNCELYKKEAGCDSSCPMLSENTRIDKDAPSLRFNKIKRFVKNNINSLYLNVGNSFSLLESNESYLFKNVKKIMIPLKNLETVEEFDSLWDIKQSNREYVCKVLNHNPQKIIMWSAYYLNMKRKGFNYLLKSLEIIKKQYNFDLGNICLIICAKHNNYEFKSELDALGIKYHYTGLLEEEEYNKFLSSADLYCSTTISDAGPRTTYESAALGTPIISFDNCNASDFVSDINGALIPTYDTVIFAEKLNLLLTLDNLEHKNMCFKMHETYKSIMDSDKLVKKWNLFFKGC